VSTLLVEPATPVTGGHADTAPAPVTARLPARDEAAPPVVDVVIPVYNEEADLDGSVRSLHAYLQEHLPFPFRITVADNASTDGTWSVVRALHAELDHVAGLRLRQKGRGRALRAAWSDSDAVVLAYMDVDLSTDLAALLPLIAPLVSGHSDLAIGTRLARGARIVRGPKRDLISRCYNAVLHTTLRTRFSDAQCGFKAIRADVATALLPMVQDEAWFFDTELLVLAERAGLRIHEVPVDWVDDPDSRVDIVDTAVKDLQGVARLGKSLLTGALPLRELRAELGRERGAPPTPGSGEGLAPQLVRFAAIGAVSTLAYLLLYAGLRGVTTAQPANLIALLVTALANTAANRRLTFGVRGGTGAVRHQLEGLAVFALGVALTSGALGLLAALAPHAGRGIELAVLVLANAVVTVLRFLLFRAWVFHPRRLSTT
jgi:putative flippase GtrA